MRNQKIKYALLAIVLISFTHLVYQFHDQFHDVLKGLKTSEVKKPKRSEVMESKTSEVKKPKRSEVESKTSEVKKSKRLEVKEPDDPVYIAEYIPRRSKVEEVCSRLEQASLTHTAYLLVRNTKLPDRSMAYCLVPKNACTFWLGVFRFLQNDRRGHSSPLEMSRFEVHNDGLKLQNYKSMAAAANDFRLMFVREPYSRLWSAYVDKLLLPDFWHSEGVRIIRKVRGNAFKKNACPNNLSFKEFIQYLVTSNPKKLNAHWAPVFYVCNPCTFKPHFIGKLETFSQDARYLLGLMNASWIFDSYDHKEHVESEVNRLIDFHFLVAHRDWKKNCTNYTDIAERLWLSFQINGYIPNATPFPRRRLVGKLDSEGKAKLKLIVHEALVSREKGGSYDVWRAQREQAKEQAYRDVPTATMRRLRDMYRHDFDMFGYDPEPPALFRDRA